MKTLFFLLLAFLLPAFSLAQTPPTPDRTEDIISRREENARVVSLLTDRQQIGSEQLQLFKAQLQLFATVLEQKLLAADPGTTMLFTPVRQRIREILTGPGTAVSPDDHLYEALDSIMAQMGENPVLAMAYEEALRLPHQPILATIQPGRGQGATYRENESVLFQVTAVRDCYVQVLFLARESIRQLDTLRPILIYPETGKGFIRMKAGQTVILGRQDEFTVQPPYGNELVLVIASENELQTDLALENKILFPPLHFGRAFAAIYGEQIADTLAVNSCFLASRPPADGRPDGRTALLSEEEAATLRLNDREWAREPLRYRSISAGPVIKVQEPALTDEDNPTIEAVTPMNLKITFEKKEAPVDMESLEVTAKKGFLAMSITERVKEHITGTVLDARNLDFPTGKFRIQVEIADVEGMVTSREYRLEVR